MLIILEGNTYKIYILIVTVIGIMRTLLVCILFMAFIGLAMGDNGINVEDTQDGSEQCTQQPDGCTRKCGQDTACKQNCYKWIQTLSIIYNIYLVACIIYFSTASIKMLTENLEIFWHDPYTKLKKQHNQVENEQMLKEEFASKRDFIIRALRNSQRQNNFYLLKNEQRHIIKVSKVKIIKQEKPLLTSIIMKGEDHGKWIACGYIMSKNNQIFMWLMKWYEDWTKVNCPLNQCEIFCEGYGQDLGVLMRGQWFHRVSMGYCGVWVLEQPRLVDDDRISLQVMIEAGH